MAFKTPILLLTFTRLDTTIRVFERIKEQKPKYLFLASDGPRIGNAEDFAKIKLVNDYILNGIDWDCEVKTLFREQNLGCGLAVSGAITWFFEHVEQGIILEDDCLPHLDFFSFCEEMLQYYKTDDRIWEISGTNLQCGIKRGDGSYYFSNYGGIWGWATWARAWKNYDFEMKNFNEFLSEKYLSKVFADKRQRSFWTDTLIESKNIDTWDYQWHQATWSKCGISIVPNVNLIDNIGFNQAGTHTLEKPVWYDKLSAGNGKLGIVKHPEMVDVDVAADDFLFENCYRGNTSLILKIYKLLKKRIKKVLNR